MTPGCRRERACSRVRRAHPESAGATSRTSRFERRSDGDGAARRGHQGAVNTVSAPSASAPRSNAPVRVPGILSCHAEATAGCHRAGARACGGGRGSACARARPRRRSRPRVVRRAGRGAAGRATGTGRRRSGATRRRAPADRARRTASTPGPIDRVVPVRGDLLRRRQLAAPAGEVVAVGLDDVAQLRVAVQQRELDHASGRARPRPLSSNSTRCCSVWTSWQTSTSGPIS